MKIMINYRIKCYKIDKKILKMLFMNENLDEK